MFHAVAQAVAWWAHLYSDSKALSAAVVFVHLSGILVAGGFAIVADRATLLLAPDEEPEFSREMDRLRAVHAFVLAGLAITVSSGVLMLLSDLHTYLTSLLFWTKMSLILLLLGNGWLRQRAETAIIGGSNAEWPMFRGTSRVSLALWFLVLLAGAFLPTIS